MQLKLPGAQPDVPGGWFLKNGAASADPAVPAVAAASTARAKPMVTSRLLLTPEGAAFLPEAEAVVRQAGRGALAGPAPASHWRR